MKDSENDFMNNKSPKIFRGKPYIICAALWVQDGSKMEGRPKNVDSGYVIAGRRHHNCFLTFQYCLNEGILKHNSIKNQIVHGFLTSDDRFLDRKEAGKLALEVGQIEKLTECLFSEDLY